MYFVNQALNNQFGCQSKFCIGDRHFILNIKSNYPPNDGSNCCAFLSVKNASKILFNRRNFFKNIKKSAENIIIQFPSKVNAYLLLADSEATYNFDYNELIQNQISGVSTLEGTFDLC